MANVPIDNIPEQKPYIGIGPFKLQIIQSFPFIEADFDAITNQQLLQKVVDYLNKVISNTNAVTENTTALYNAYVELENYVNNYFQNLDVQNEINNKLDEMAQDGTLQEIITSYLNSQAIFGYINVNDMKNATNLINGSYAQTLGYYNMNDGGKAQYKIRNITNNDTVDEMFIISLNNSTTLIAELITDDIINIKQLGAKSDGVTDTAPVFNNAISKFNTIYVPKGKYKLNTTINLNKNTNIYGDGTITTWSGNTPTTVIISPSNTYAFACVWGNSNKFSNLTFQGYGINQPCGTQITNCEFTGQIGLNNVRVTTVSKCSFHNCTTAGIQTLTDSKILDNFIFNNEIGIDVSNSNDNMILNNKIEWNNIGINLFQSVFNMINSNIFDRQTTYGITATNCTNIEIINNQFERNLTNHIRISGSNIIVNNNTFFAKNSQDDGSGTLMPVNAVYTLSVSNFNFINNMITTPANGKVFQANPDYQSNATILNNFRNGLRTDEFTKTFKNITVPAGQTITKQIQWSELDYLGLNGYDVTIISWQYYNSATSLTQNVLRDNQLINLYYHNNNGLYITLTNSTETDINFSLNVRFKNNSQFKV